MDGYDDWQLKWIEEEGFTPESAREYAVEKLRKAGATEEGLKKEGLLAPIDKIGSGNGEAICKLMHKGSDEPENYCRVNKCDLSDWLTLSHLITSLID